MASSQNNHLFHWHYADLEDHHFQIRGRTLFSIILILAVILISSLVYAYIRWVCSFNRHAPSPTSHAPPLPLSQHRGLDPATIDALPVTIVTLGGKASESSSECCICLGAFEDGEKVKVLPFCKHSYHPECVDKWLSTESSCPLCRASLRVESDQVHHLPVIVTQ